MEIHKPENETQACDWEAAEYLTYMSYKHDTVQGRVLRGVYIIHSLIKLWGVVIYVQHRDVDRCESHLRYSL